MVLHQLVFWAEELLGSCEVGGSDCWAGNWVSEEGEVAEVLLFQNPNHHCLVATLEVCLEVATGGPTLIVS